MPNLSSEMWSTQRSVRSFQQCYLILLVIMLKVQMLVTTLNVIEGHVLPPVKMVRRALRSWPVGQSRSIFWSAHSEGRSQRGTSPTGIVYRKLIARRHGHRCVQEAELRNKDWSEEIQPTSRSSLLQENVSAMSYNTKGSRTHKMTSITLDEMLKTNWSHVSCFDSTASSVCRPSNKSWSCS